jgi:heme-degrading monooxygenase HmoA
VTQQQIDRDRQYTAMASRLPLKSHWSIPGFMRDTMRIRRQLAHSPGLVGYTLNAQLFAKTFWTFSVWENEEALKAFAATDPHRSIIQRLRPRMAATRFEFFPLAGSEVPLPWEQIMARAS